MQQIEMTQQVETNQQIIGELSYEKAVHFFSDLTNQFIA